MAGSICVLRQGVAIVLLIAGLGLLAPSVAEELPVDYESTVPRYIFANTREEQKTQLKSNPLMLRFVESRRKLAEDPHRPMYHFVNPESRMGDANGLCFWRNRWHLFYQVRPPGEDRVHWGHATSADLVHWRDLPYAIYPQPEYHSYSGSTFVENDRVIAMYHGTRVGNMVAVSSDPLLLNWEKLTGQPVIPIKNADGSALPYRVFDPCIRKVDGQYFALSGRTQDTGPGQAPVRAHYLFQSTDLVHWKYLHPFVEGDRFTMIGDDGACPYFWPIGNRHILLFFSHISGGQYLLGDYDRARRKFDVTSHGLFNFGATEPGGVHAPTATPDGKGGVITILNMNPATYSKKWSDLMTLPRRLFLTDHGELRIEPAGDIESLRYDHRQIGGMELPANEEIVLDDIRGNSMEIIARFDSKSASVVELNVLRSPNREEVTRIVFFKHRGYQRQSLIALDSTYSSHLSTVDVRAPETAPIDLGKDEVLELRVFIDKSVVEVFANGKQCIAVRVYPGRSDSLGVSLRAQGRPSQLMSLDAWQMRSIY